MTAYLWEQMTAAQQAAAQGQQASAGVGVKGLPPSGPGGVIWLLADGQWSWLSALWPDTLRRGVKLGRRGR